MANYYSRAPASNPYSRAFSPPPKPSMVTVKLPPEVAPGVFIGAKGCNIQALQQITGVRLWYAPEQHEMHVMGHTEDARAKAVSLINKLAHHIHLAGYGLGREQKFTLLLGPAYAQCEEVEVTPPRFGREALQARYQSVQYVTLDPLLEQQAGQGSPHAASAAEAAASPAPADAAATTPPKKRGRPRKATATAATAAGDTAAAQGGTAAAAATAAVRSASAGSSLIGAASPSAAAPRPAIPLPEELAQAAKDPGSNPAAFDSVNFGVLPPALTEHSMNDFVASCHALCAQRLVRFDVLTVRLSLGKLLVLASSGMLRPPSSAGSQDTAAHQATGLPTGSSDDESVGAPYGDATARTVADGGSGDHSGTGSSSSSSSSSHHDGGSRTRSSSSWDTSAAAYDAAVSSPASVMRPCRLRLAALANARRNKDFRVFFGAALPIAAITPLHTELLDNLGFENKGQFNSVALHLTTAVQTLQYHVNFSMRPDTSLRLTDVETVDYKAHSVVVLGAGSQVDLRLRLGTANYYAEDDDTVVEIRKLARDGLFSMAGKQLLYPKAKMDDLGLRMHKVRVKYRREYVGLFPRDETVVPEPAVVPELAVAPEPVVAGAKRKGRAAKAGKAAAPSASTSTSGGSNGLQAAEEAAATPLLQLPLKVSVAYVIAEDGHCIMEANVVCDDLDNLLSTMHAAVHSTAQQGPPGARNQAEPRQALPLAQVPTADVERMAAMVRTLHAFGDHLQRSIKLVPWVPEQQQQQQPAAEQQQPQQQPVAQQQQPVAQQQQTNGEQERLAQAREAGEEVETHQASPVANAARTRARRRATVTVQHSTAQGEIR